MFDFLGLFAAVERGVTRYNVLPSIRILQNHFKSTSNSSEITHFTTLQTCFAFQHSTSRPIRPGTILEPISTSNASPSSTTNRLRTLIANIPHSLNKHRILTHQSTRIVKSTLPPNEFLEVRSTPFDEHLCLKLDTVSVFVGVHTTLPSTSRSTSSNPIQGLCTVEVLSQLTEQYPLITELIVSQGFEDNVPNNVGYPCRRITVHRLVKNHRRIVAFDMKNYTFVEIDATNSVDIYALEQDDTLFQRYQAQLRWCDKHISSFRSQIKTIVHSSTGNATFVQATLFSRSTTSTVSSTSKFIVDLHFTIEKESSTNYFYSTRTDFSSESNT